MLYDRLENLEQYLGLCDNLDLCIQWIAEHDLSALPLGRVQIAGEAVFADVMQVQLTGEEEANFETHERYLDLQVVLEGSQLFQVALGEVTEVTPYDPQRDCGFCAGSASCAGVLDPSRFVVFLPQEPHKPNLRTADHAASKKVVFKIAR